MLWMYHYFTSGLVLVVEGFLALVGLWVIGLCFNVKQKKVEPIVPVTQLTSNAAVEEKHEEEKEITKPEIILPAEEDNAKHNPTFITQESNKQGQSDLTPIRSTTPPLPSPLTINYPSTPIFPPPTPPFTPSSPSPSLSPLSSSSSTPVSPDTAPEVLAREERRRKRDERRAARANRDPKPEITFKSPIEYLEDRCKVDVHSYFPYDKKKKCLVLDIDYTIFDHKSDFDLALEFKRPYLHEFLKICGAYYNIVVWSATAFFHIHTKMEKLQLFNHPDFQICFVLSKDHMIPHAFSIKRKTYIQDIKPLSLLWMKYPEVFNAENTIHIDDVEENFVLNPNNGLRIDPFREALLFRQTDRELFYLAQYLTMIADLPSFSNLNHCRWKDYIINTLWDLQTVLSLPTFTPPDPPTSHLLEHHHQSLVIKQKLKEKAKDQEREERMQRHMDDDKRRGDGEKENGMLMVNYLNNSETNGKKKEATEDELIKLAREAMEGNNSPSRSAPRTPTNRTPPPKSPLSSFSSKPSPLSSSSSYPSPSLSHSHSHNPPKSPSRTPPKSPARTPLSVTSPSFSPSSSSSTPPKSPSRAKQQQQQQQQNNNFLTIPNIHNIQHFSSSSPQPILTLNNHNHNNTNNTPNGNNILRPLSPNKDKRTPPRGHDESEIREIREIREMREIRETAMENDWRNLNEIQLLDLLRHSPTDSFSPISLPVSPIAN